LNESILIFVTNFRQKCLTIWITFGSTN